ncbi:hypothetical protein ACWEN3_35065, partial [Streptomyces sp. NPDC004561]
DLSRTAYDHLWMHFTRMSSYENSPVPTIVLPRKGRARPHAEKSLGTPDAGAHSLALITRVVHGVLLDRSPDHH